MSLENHQTTDIQLLLGLINTALRNEHEDLDDLVKTHDIDRTILENRLSELGMAYSSEVNQFRPTTQQ